MSYTWERCVCGHPRAFHWRWGPRLIFGFKIGHKRLPDSCVEMKDWNNVDILCGCRTFKELKG